MKQIISVLVVIEHDWFVLGEWLKGLCGALISSQMLYDSHFNDLVTLMNEIFPKFVGQIVSARWDLDRDLK